MIRKEIIQLEWLSECKQSIKLLDRDYDLETYYQSSIETGTLNEAHDQLIFPFEETGICQKNVPKQDSERGAQSLKCLDKRLQTS